ncbi:MAG: hypothetical protein JXQ90_18065 [Cyclobacteriaceae bacterium]
MGKMKVSIEYKKAFNQADMICRFMPQELEKLGSLENVSPEYRRGFEDRIKQHQMEKDVTKDFSVEELKEKYGKDLEGLAKDQDKDKGLEHDM